MHARTYHTHLCIAEGRQLPQLVWVFHDVAGMHLSWCMPLVLSGFLRIFKA
jgi:hypothetical protein